MNTEQTEQTEQNEQNDSFDDLLTSDQFSALVVEQNDQWKLLTSDQFGTLVAEWKRHISHMSPELAGILWGAISAAGGHIDSCPGYLPYAAAPFDSQFGPGEGRTLYTALRIPLAGRSLAHEPAWSTDRGADALTATANELAVALAKFTGLLRAFG